MIQFDLRIFFKRVGEKPPTSTQYQLCFESFGSHLFFSEPIPGIWLLKCSSVGLAWTIGFENSAPLTPLEVGTLMDWRFPALRPEKKLPQNGIGKEVVVFQSHHFSGAFAVQLSGVVTIMETEINSREGEMVDQILYF